MFQIRQGAVCFLSGTIYLTLWYLGKLPEAAGAGWLSFALLIAIFGGCICVVDGISIFGNARKEILSARQSRLAEEENERGWKLEALANLRVLSRYEELALIVLLREQERRFAYRGLIFGELHRKRILSTTATMSVYEISDPIWEIRDQLLETFKDHNVPAKINWSWVD